jgi:predicted nucleic acid-binding protein
MKAILIDSDILIEVSRGRDAEVIRRWDELSMSETVLLCSPVSVAELWHGARSADYPILDRLFSALNCLSIDAATGRRAGEYLRKYSKSHGVELGDALIASSACLHDLSIWTRNRKHYPMKDVNFF